MTNDPTFIAECHLRPANLSKTLKHDSDQFLKIIGERDMHKQVCECVFYDSDYLASLLLSHSGLLKIRKKYAIFKVRHTLLPEVEDNVKFPHHMECLVLF